MSSALARAAATVCTKENVVIVRIWTSGIWGPLSGVDLPMGEDVGHASLEIPLLGMYVSLWPERPIKGTELGARISPFFHVSFDKDIEAEGRGPEKTFRFYSLNVREMEKYFKERIPRIKYWKAMTLGIWERTEESDRKKFCNCSSLVTEILVSGGIGPLLEERRPGFRMNVTDPDDLARKLKYAKKRELELYEETGRFSDDVGTVGAGAGATTYSAGTDDVVDPPPGFGYPADLDSGEVGSPDIGEAGAGGSTSVRGNM